MLKGLIELRNNACLGMAVINLLWIAINLMFQLTLPTKINIKLSVSICFSKFRAAVEILRRPNVYKF